ncbi:MAG: ubiquitin-like small modifier protein 1 [archaeon]
MVLVQLFAYFSEIAGKKEFEIDAENVDELLGNLIVACDKLTALIYESYESRVLNSDVMILVNGRNMKALSGIRTGLKKDDVISIFPPICGG